MLKQTLAFVAGLVLCGSLALAQSRDTRMGVNGPAAASGGTTYTSQADGGVVVTGTVIACEAASATGSGCVNTTTQTFGGSKTLVGPKLYTTGLSGLIDLSQGDTVIDISRSNLHTTWNAAGANLIQMYYGAGSGTAPLFELGSTFIRFRGGTVSCGTGFRLNTEGAAEPTCDSTVRGMIWYTTGAGGVADKMQVCAKAAADTYAWRSMATIP